MTTGEQVAFAAAVADPSDELARSIDKMFVDDVVTEAARLGETLVVELLVRMRADRDLGEASKEIGVSRWSSRRRRSRPTRPGRSRATRPHPAASFESGRIEGLVAAELADEALAADNAVEVIATPRLSTAAGLSPNRFSRSAFQRLSVLVVGLPW